MVHPSRTDNEPGGCYSWMSEAWWGVAVAANANVAAPIDAAVGANVGSVNSDAVAVSQQDAVINQDITGEANATSDQASDIQQ